MCQQFQTNFTNLNEFVVKSTKMFYIIYKHCIFLLIIIVFRGGIQMANYAKIMKKFDDHKYIVKSFDVEDLSKFGSYPDKMKKIYEQGYSQVIINSKIMLSLLERVIENKNLEFISFEVNDPSLDEETRTQINKIIENLKSKKMGFSAVKEYLFWVFDEGSIFIDKLILYNYEKSSNIEINSNGLIYFDNKEEFVDLVIANLESYLNE